MVISKDPNGVRNKFIRDMMEYDENIHTITKGMKGSLVGALNKYANGDANRKLILAWLCGEKTGSFSSKSMTNAQWYAILLWINPYKDDEEWHVSPTFPVECAAVLTAAMRAYNMMQYKEGDKIVPIDEIDHIILEAIGIGGVITKVTDDQGNSKSNTNVEYPMNYFQEQRPSNYLRRITNVRNN